MKYFIIFVTVFLSTATRSLGFKCEPIDAQLQKLCHNVGYNYTANFHAQNGIRYDQDKVYNKIRELLSWFSNCSKLSSLLVCSRYVPMCVEDDSSPVLPCKEVCEEFVQNCAEKLDERNLKLQYTALCQLLPETKGNPRQGKCLRPEEFQRSSNNVETLPKCSSSGLLCQQYNRSMSQNMAVSSGGNLSNQCLEGLQRIACFSQSTPCISGKLPYQPCRSFCEKVQKNCSLGIAKLNVSFSLECSDLPDKASKGDLCKMDRWLVPWPNKTEDIITCYCDTCGPNNTCQTNGSCFIQSLITNKEMTTERTCLHPGKQREFICQHDQYYPLAKCCKDDHCNKELEGLSTVPTTTKSVIPITEEKVLSKATNKTGETTTNTSTVVTSPTVPHAFNNSANPRAVYCAHTTTTIGILIVILQNQQII